MSADAAVRELPQLLDFAASAERAGFRLRSLEVYNWGTFHDKVSRILPLGDNALLTGDIGSGKSTLVDAVTTLLVPAHRVAYNKAAGAETRERSLRSYVLGYYKSERADVGLSSRPVALRDHNAYSVILGVFYNEGYAQTVTLAQFFWIKDGSGQPARAYVVADRALTIEKDFARFGSDIQSLRKKLRAQQGVELFDSFPPYMANFKRRFGIESDQALELFHQTVSMKSVGNLTDFVREHMLEVFDAQSRIDALCQHFDNLTRAHEAVLKAKAQVALLTPLVADCALWNQLTVKVDDLRGCRDALKAYFAGLKAELLQKRMLELTHESESIAAKRLALEDTKRNQQLERDALKGEIAKNGGDRIAGIGLEITQKQRTKDERQKRADRYEDLMQGLELDKILNSDDFIARKHQLGQQLLATNDAAAHARNAEVELGVEMRQLKTQHDDLQAEIASLRKRRSNIADAQIQLRQKLCADLALDENAMLFAGELLQVRPEDALWQGAAERVLHNFALSLLVADKLYPQVADWVDRTHLGQRLVYFRVTEPSVIVVPALHEQSLANKIAIKPDCLQYPWLEREIGRRFDYACCENLAQFRRERKALTQAGQIKGSDERHEKDDRHRLDDRSRYVLGWSNEAKIKALEQKALILQGQIQQLAEKLGKAQSEVKKLEKRKDLLNKIEMFQDFAEMDWQPLALEIDKLEQERKALQMASNVLHTLNLQLKNLDEAIEKTEKSLADWIGKEGNNKARQDNALRLLSECHELSAMVEEQGKERRFAQLRILQKEVLGTTAVLVESCDARERDVRDKLAAMIDAEDRKIKVIRDRIVSAMAKYRETYPLETQEIDARIEAADAYKDLLDKLAADDLPKFEARFKELLNENTIREVANFQSQLARERRSIGERIDRINESLARIDYNPDRYIKLEALPNPDREIIQFNQDLRNCTEGALTGSDDEQYSEDKFLQVKRIIERFRGTDLDAKWTGKVTDVRNWFVFSASERWRADNTEHEHYTDSGGKSGGQKEKLAYTVLAASLAYQFGLDGNAGKSRTFRFVVIDEAFGRGSNESARFGLELFQKMNLQLLIVTPLQKIDIIEPFVSSVGFVHSEGGKESRVKHLTIAEHLAEKEARRA